MSKSNHKSFGFFFFDFELKECLWVPVFLRLCGAEWEWDFLQLMLFLVVFAILVFLVALGGTLVRRASFWTRAPPVAF